MPRASSKTRRASEPHAQRLRALKKHIADAGADAFFVSDPADVAYLTGFLGGDSFLLVTPTGKPKLISDHRYAEDLEAHKHLATIVMRDGQMALTLGRLLAGLRFDDGRRKPTLLLQGEHLTLRQLDLIKTHALRKFKIPVRVATPVTGVLSKMRAVKDDSEVRLIRRAVRIQEEALEATLEHARPGVTELELAAHLEFEMKSRGSTEPAFLPIVGAGASSAKPHYTPSGVKIRKGGPLLIDWGATWRGYRSDMTRTFVVGRSWPRELASIYDAVHEAHLAAVEVLKAGALCKDADDAARGVISKAGHGKRFNHGLGHGIGLHVHEAPSLSRHSGEATLRAGHVVTIEPGVYLPGRAGVRLENDYLITERGSTSLCSLPMDRDWARL
ncbi:MAG: M24 family metallopeptidase [Phycisphaerales bacterium JB040]